MPPPKKRKFSQSTDGSVGDDASPAPAPKVRRRKKPVLQYDPLEFCQELYDTIRNHKTEDGRLLCEAFIRVPKRRADPEYYDVVTLPIDLLRIQHKLKSEEYDEIEQLTSDIELMVNNAKAFYKPDSREYQDACDLWDLYSDTKNILIAEAFGDTTEKESTQSKDAVQSEKEDDCSSTMTEDEDSIYEQLFATVVMAKEGDRIISEMFKVLPSRVRYPEYYNVIKNPMDLKMIAQKIQGNEYTCLDEMLTDLILMISNAKGFNEPGSQIYKDAVTLKKIIHTRKTELETGRQRSARRSARRNQHPNQRLSAICAALTYDEEDESDINSLQDGESSHPMEMDMDDSVTESGAMALYDETSPEWQLFNSVMQHRSANGHLLAEPFTRLPSRRMYPDYYEEIKKPLSLLNVQKKLKHNQYRTLNAIGNDLELVFENAKQYNMDESKLYLDAAALQHVLRTKRKELTGREIDQSSMMQNPTLKAKRYDSEERKTPKRKSLTPEDVLRKRLNILYKTVLDYQVDSRSLVDIFMVLPCKDDYPDYYQVISEPIDMTVIDMKIKADKYASDQALIADFELMFNNARHYNEEASQVYRDADALEKVLKRKLSQLVPLDSPRACKVKGKTPKSKTSLSPLEQKLQDLYSTIKDYSDSRSRILSTPFMKLPLRAEYPDYYEVIKRPIDMLKVNQRLMSKSYETLEDMVADFVLLFDNACKYNEPDSLIYKDALTLQRICLEKKQELCADDDANEVPNVRAIVQEMMTNLYIAMYNHTDEDGRCYSDSFQDMPIVTETKTNGQTEDKEKTRRRPPSFEQVKKNLDRNRYRRFDRFQEDIFEVFEYSRRVSRTDSQLYEDGVELQLFFIKKRDEMCKNGELLLTPALSYTERHLILTLEWQEEEKLPEEQREDEEKRQQQEAEAKQTKERLVETKDAAANAGPNVDMDLIEHNNMTFTLGDFVYVELREKSPHPHIICIEKMWRNESGEAFLYGNFYHRPQETYHVATKKFLEKEVFKSDVYEDMPFARVIGKCAVMSVKDYFKMRPDLIPDNDVYVCESRYSSRQRAFKKIKIWQVPRNEVRLVARDVPLTPVRVASVFANKVEGIKEEKDEEGDEQNMLDKERENIEIEKDVDNSDGCVHYEQYKTTAGWFKLGDCVYVRSEEDKPYIAMIDKIWTDQSGSAFFHGPWFVHPIEVEHSPTRLFYKREVFRSSIEDTNPMLSIQGRCAVLVHKDYCVSRPTELPEQDVYICESKYMEGEKSIRKLAKSMKKPVLSSKACDDEIYFFKKPIIPQKEPSPLLQKATEEVYPDDADEDPSRPESAENGNFAFKEELSLDSIPDIIPKEKKKKSAKPWQPSGYLVFSAESRKQVQEENPDLTFGDISKVVGSKWREMPKEDKVRYEEKAKKLAEEHAAKQEAADKAFNTSLALFPPAQSPTADGARATPTAPAAPSRSLTLSTPVTQANSSATQQPQPATAPARPPSPMFVTVPPRTQRLLHTEAYLKYIEGLGKDNNSVGQWQKSMTATPENTPLDRHAKLPVSWLGQGVGHHENTVQALWALRDLMMKDTLSIQRTLEFTQL